MTAVDVPLADSAHVKVQGCRGSWPQGRQGKMFWIAAKLLGVCISVYVQSIRRVAFKCSILDIIGNGRYPALHSWDISAWFKILFGGLMIINVYISQTKSWWSVQYSITYENLKMDSGDVKSSIQLSPSPRHSILLAWEIESNFRFGCHTFLTEKLLGHVNITRPWERFYFAKRKRCC